MSEPDLPKGRLDVPVFPLPKLVMFPGTLLPLHIFELRYRNMLSDALLSDQRLIAVVQLKPGWEQEGEVNPPIYDVAGIGKIAAHTHNPDGTYDIVLDAIARVRLQELEPGGLTYRRATATVLRERTTKEVVRSSEVTALLALASRIETIVQRALPGFALQATEDDSPALLSDRIADQFVLAPAARQDLLETLDVGSRIRSLMVQLAQLHLALCSNDDGGSPTIH
ncbi:MAG TPA: LON peptidase substrate-binding domain-containing protein [Polyangiales bacterium]|nr:LON peptidase substrate-binding domain-containing protein [Polyangiales bacterium]